jgi:ferritin-like metal-binding protein YciE
LTDVRFDEIRRERLRESGESGFVCPDPGRPSARRRTQTAFDGFPNVQAFTCAIERGRISYITLAGHQSALPPSHASAFYEADETQSIGSGSDLASRIVVRFLIALHYEWRADVPHLNTGLTVIPDSKDTAMADKNTIKDLLADELKDLYSAEKQLTKAIPKMIKGSNDAALKDAFRGHLAETEAQVGRLDQIGELLDIKLTGKKCVGMEGCIQEGAEALQEKGEEAVLDLGIIGAGSRVEHYEMAGYLTAIGLAERIGAKEVVKLLRETLAEEEGAEKKLRQIASGLMKHAATDAETASGLF